VSATRDSASPRDLAHAADTGALLYGALIAASVLATASAHAEAFTYVAVATVLVLGVYWMAHVYVEAQRMQISGDDRLLHRRLGHTARRELSIIQGGLPAIAVFVATDLAGASVSTAAAVAVYFSVAVLVGAGYLIARQAGRRGWMAVLDSAAAGLLGVVVIIAKAMLH
jgi:hypothetical protein